MTETKRWGIGSPDGVAGDAADVNDDCACWHRECKCCTAWVAQIAQERDELGAVLDELHRLRDRVDGVFRSTKEEMAERLERNRSYPTYLKHEAKTLEWMLSEIDAAIERSKAGAK